MTQQPGAADKVVPCGGVDAGLSPDPATVAREGCAHTYRPTTAPVANNILAFVGENENGALACGARNFMDLMTPYGFNGHVVNLLDESWKKQFHDLLERGVLFCWGAAGVGAGLKSGDQSLWDILAVPFISVFADNPAYLPRKHRIAAKFVANGYLFDDWLKFQRTLIRSPQISSLLPFGTPANAVCDTVTWSERQHRMVFVKTGCAPEVVRAQWVGLPKRFRAVIEDAASVALRQNVGDVNDIVLQCVGHHGLYLEQRPDVLFRLMSHVDRYVRDSRSTAMVKALSDLPVDIIGRGWDHVATSGSRARFHGAIDATKLPDLYANTQFLINTMPNFSTGTHERVLDGFAAKCCIISNENDDMRCRFGSLPSYLGVDTEAADLSEHIKSIYFSIDRYDDRMQPALDLVHAEFSGEGLMRGIIDLATEVKMAAGAEFADYQW